MNSYDIPEIMDWLLSGDVSLQYLVRRDLLDETKEELAPLRARIPLEGWGKSFLKRQQKEGHWGQGFYQPKWISTHYTLLDLMHLGLPSNTPGPVSAVRKTIEAYLAANGALNFAGVGTVSDDCVGAMFLGVASFFGADNKDLDQMADYLLGKRLPDGAWNCDRDRVETYHSSVHTTISCLEGFHLYRQARPNHRPGEIETALRGGEEFLLKHELGWSHRTGKVMDKRMLLISWPCRWYYDILRGLVYFADAGRPWDKRLGRALDVLMSKRRKDGRWPVQNRHPGKTHFEMEKTGGPSRWNTYRALKVLRSYEAAY